MCPPSDISIDPVLRGVFDVSISTDVAEPMACVVAAFTGAVRSTKGGEQHEVRKRMGGGQTERAGSILR